MTDGVEAIKCAWDTNFDPFGWHGPMYDWTAAESRRELKREEAKREKELEVSVRRRAYSSKKRQKSTSLKFCKVWRGAKSLVLRKAPKTPTEDSDVARPTNPASAFRPHTARDSDSDSSRRLRGEAFPLQTSAYVQSSAPNNTIPLHGESAFLNKLPTELRIQIYVIVLQHYPTTIHVVSGSGLGNPRRRILHSPCITTPNQDVPSWGWFARARWGSGLWGTYHFHCDLYTTPPSNFHCKVLDKFEDYAKALGEPRTPCEVVANAEKHWRGKAPFLPLLLSCRQICSESIRVIYSTLSMSFIGDRPFSIFLQTVKPDLVHNLQSLHLVWPSWWKFKHDAFMVNRRFMCDERYWPPPEPDPSKAKADWHALVQLLVDVGLLNRLHITIFQVPSETIDGYDFRTEELVASLRNVKARHFVIEVYGAEQKVQEPSDEIPYQLRYYPALEAQHRSEPAWSNLRLARGH